MLWKKAALTNCLRIPRGQGVPGKWLSWDFIQEHEKGERKKGTAFTLNKYFLTNFNPAASFFACFLNLMTISVVFFLNKLKFF